MDRKMIFSLLLAVISVPVSSDEWKASVVKSLDALVSSCLVVPCSFTHTGGNLPASRLRGIWHRRDHKDQLIYHEDNSRVLDNFKGRTNLLGNLGQSNCTLEMMDVKNHDNGPFCFRIELVQREDNKPTKEKFSFVEDCVELNMLAEPPTPTLHYPKTAYEGQPYTLTCSVTHTCPSHVPKLTWSKETTDPIYERNKDIHYGNWEVESFLTIVPKEKDDHSEITCTAEFNGKITSSRTMTLYVKRAVNYNYIIIPTVVGVVTAVIFGLFCILMTKKYKKRIADLQSQDGSMWNRLSRMSRRFRSDEPSGPSRSDQRRSIWSRFSRRPKRDIQIPNNMNIELSKPRFPSPKSQPKSNHYKEDFDDIYMNTADNNIYGNL